MEVAGLVLVSSLITINHYNIKKWSIKLFLIGNPYIHCYVYSNDLIFLLAFVLMNLRFLIIYASGLIDGYSDYKLIDLSSSSLIASTPGGNPDIIDYYCSLSTEGCYSFIINPILLNYSYCCCIQFYYIING